MKIFLAGGTGFVGGHVRRALREKGHEIVLLTHRRPAGDESGVHTVSGNIADSETLVPIIRGCDAVINLIGIIREFPLKGITYEKLHVEATGNLLHAARQLGIRRYLHMSALGSRHNATARYHRSKFAAEEFVLDSGLDFTIFRPSIIFGPEDNFVNKLAALIRYLPVVPVIGNGTYRLQPIAADDVARCFAMSLEMPETIGKTFLLCGPDRLSYNELLEVIGRTLGKTRLRKVRSPLGMVRLATRFLEEFPMFPLTSDQLTMLLEESVCDGSWQETFSFKPLGFAEGISRYLAGK